MIPCDAFIYADGSDVCQRCAGRVEDHSVMIGPLRYYDSVEALEAALGPLAPRTKARLLAALACEVCNAPDAKHRVRDLSGEWHRVCCECWRKDVPHAPRDCSRDHEETAK